MPIFFSFECSSGARQELPAGSTSRTVRAMRRLAKYCSVPAAQQGYSSCHRRKGAFFTQEPIACLAVRCRKGEGERGGREGGEVEVFTRLLHISKIPFTGKNVFENLLIPFLRLDLLTSKDVQPGPQEMSAAVGSSHRPNSPTFQEATTAIRVWISLSTHSPAPVDFALLEFPSFL